MKTLIFIVNLPFTLLGLVPLILSGPYSLKVKKDPIAFIFQVKSFWWAKSYLENARAMTIGNIILLSQKTLKNDLDHEIIHIKQSERYPFIYPFLYYHELLKRGYRKNRFEDEAYKVSKSYYGKYENAGASWKRGVKFL